MSDYTKLPRDIAECMRRAGSPLSEDQRLLLAGYLAPVQQKLAESAARVAGIKQIIATEPELPGEMPEGMWQAFVDAINEGDRAFVMVALRIAVKETKDCILERIHEAERSGGEK